MYHLPSQLSFHNLRLPESSGGELVEGGCGAGGVVVVVVP